MTIQTRVTSSASDDRWEAATCAANLWRGQAIQIFAQAELAVSEALETLAAVPDRGEKVRMRRLVGHRFEDLREALAGCFAEEGIKAAGALEKFAKHQELRTFLCHGVAKLALDRNEKWLVVLKLAAIRGRSAERTSRSIEEQNADELLTMLREDCRKLMSALQSLRSRLRS